MVSKTEGREGGRGRERATEQEETHKLWNRKKKDQLQLCRLVRDTV